MRGQSDIVTHTTCILNKSISIQEALFRHKDSTLH